MGATSSTAERPRRTQAERRAETRAKLLTAAIDCLVERGYADATTPDICRRAGVSQGALFKHFPTKSELLVAAVEQLYAEFRQQFRKAVGSLPEQDDRIGAAVHELWRIFAHPKQLAALELQVAARTDATLADALWPLLEAHWEGILGLARELFPEPARVDGPFEAFVGILISMMQGGAIGTLVRPRPNDVEQSLVYLEWLARQLLTDGGDLPHLSEARR